MCSNKISLENVTPLGVDVTKVRAPLAYICGHCVNVTPQASIFLGGSTKVGAPKREHPWLILVVIL